MTIKKNQPYVDAAEEDSIIDELEGDQPSQAAESDAAIVRKYEKTEAGIIVQKNDFLVHNIIRMLKDKELLDISPYYQRRPRWNDEKRSGLIESLLLNVPIPAIFLYEYDYAHYEVLDGQQRLSTLNAFINDEFKLKGLRRWSELNGRVCSDLPKRIRDGITRRSLPAIIILTNLREAEADEIRQYVFERLNTGGQALNAQEVRNCIYSGSLNDAIVELSRGSSFTKCWGIPPKEAKEPHRASQKLLNSKLYSTMRDCEMVLRYFALSDLSEYTSGLKKTLDAFMKVNRNPDPAQLANWREEFEACCDLSWGIYGDEAFRLEKGGSLKGPKSVNLYDCVMHFLSKHRKKKDHLLSKAQDIREATLAMLLDEEKLAPIADRTNTKSVHEERRKMVMKELGAAIK